MRGTIPLFKVRNISINIHMTFFLLLLLGLYGGIKWMVFILGVFCFVTLHELCHSFVAQKFGIQVKDITLLPIGGVASMARMPEKPSEEFLISVAGPLFNLAVVAIFYFPLRFIVGPEILHSFFERGPSLQTWTHVFVYIYWVNLILAAFNLIPAFPMDGGRILRSLLTPRMGYRRATRVAVNLGHAFALLFGYIGLRYGNIILIVIAVFIYMAASSEELQVSVKETLKKFRVKDIVPTRYLTLDTKATLGKVLETIFHSHQEDFPIIEDSRMVGFVTRKDIIRAVHERDKASSVSDIMHTSFPVLHERDSLDKAQRIMQEFNMRALPVVRGEATIGVVTIEDISRVYSMMSARR